MELLLQCIKGLERQQQIKLANPSSFATNNAHMFYIIVNNVEERDALLAHLKVNGVHAVFHYLSLHKSPFHLKNIEGDIQNLPQADYYTNCLIRLPLFYDLKTSSVEQIASTIKAFYK